MVRHSPLLLFEVRGLRPLTTLPLPPKRTSRPKIKSRPQSLPSVLEANHLLNDRSVAAHPSPRLIPNDAHTTIANMLEPSSQPIVCSNNRQPKLAPYLNVPSPSLRIFPKAPAAEVSTNGVDNSTPPSPKCSAPCVSMPLHLTIKRRLLLRPIPLLSRD